MRRNGVIKAPLKMRDYDFYSVCGANISDISDLPREFILPIDENCVVKDQGDVGACVCFALSTIKEYQHKESFGEHIVWSPGRIYGSPECRNGYIGYGMIPETTLKGLMKIGFVPNIAFDYLEEVPDIIDKVSERSDLYEIGAPYKIKGYTRIAYALKEKRTEAIMRALYTYKLPLLITSDDYFRGGSHAIVAYGYRINNKDEVEFAFRNSWGIEYKNKGNSFIPAEHVNEAYPIVFQDYEIPFTDVNTSDWFYDDIRAGVFSGLIKGVSEGKFEPNVSIIRGDIAIIISRLLSKLETSVNAFIKTLEQKGMSAAEISFDNGALYDENFQDIDTHDYFYSEVKMACANNVMNGVSEILFDPNKNVTRAELATIVVRVYEYIKILLEAAIPDLCAYEDTPACGYCFPDVSRAEWYCEYIDRATSIGLVYGDDDGKFRPNDSVTRAEATVVLNRLFKAIDNILEHI